MKKPPNVTARCKCGKPKHPSMPVCQECWMGIEAKVTTRAPRR